MAGAPTFRSVHEGLMSPLDLVLVDKRRGPLLARATGRVLELGGGRGSNLAHYGTAVTGVDVVGAEPRARGAIGRAVAAASVPGRVLDGGTTLASLAEASYDTVVATFVLCAVDDLSGTLDAIARLLAPRGQLLFFEHVPPNGGRSLMRMLTAPAWALASGGCDLTCDVPAAVTAAGFLITTLERSTVPTFNLSMRAVAAGLARRPLGAPGPA
jgi:SAM-dependent methyltransferase